MSPLYPLLSGDTGPWKVPHEQYWFIGSAIVTAAAICLQTAADNQLHHFRQHHSAEEVLETGVWAYSRHPNYFGEFAFWTGVCGLGLSAGVQPWMCTGVVVVASFFRLASIPLMDARMLQRRPRYAATIKRVSAFVPWFRAETHK